MSVVRRRGRPTKCWMDGVKEALARKGLTSRKQKFMCQIEMNVAVYVVVCDIPLVSLQQDV